MRKDKLPTERRTKCVYVRLRPSAVRAAQATATRLTHETGEAVSMAKALDWLVGTHPDTEAPK